MISCCHVGAPEGTPLSQWLLVIFIESPVLLFQSRCKSITISYFIYILCPSWNLGCIAAIFHSNPWQLHDIHNFLGLHPTKIQSNPIKSMFILVIFQSNLDEKQSSWLHPIKTKCKPSFPWLNPIKTHEKPPASAILYRFLHPSRTFVAS